MNDNVKKIIEETCENICDNFCKYRDTCDENCECEWIRNGNDCPLDKLYKVCATEPKNCF